MAAKNSKQPPAADGARTLTLTQRVAQLNRWREAYNPLRGLTIARAVHLTEAYFRGEMADLQWAYFFIEQTDPDLIALLELRLGRILEMDYQVRIADEADEADEAAGEKQQEFLKARFDAIDNLYDGIEHLAMAPFRGFAHLEKWYTGAEVTHLEVVDQWNVVRDGLRGAWKYNPEARSVGFRGLPENALLPEDAFIFREVRRPINRYALLKFVRSNLSEKDWDAYVEIYGIPGGVVIGPPNVPADKAAEYAAEAQKIAEGGSGYVPNGGDWKPNTGARGNQPFKERLDHLSEKLVLAGTGGKLTMLTDATGLGSGASDKHGDVFDTIARAEARRISEIFNRQLVAGWLDAAFPGQPHLAYFELAANEEVDVSQVITDIKTLADAGFAIDPAQVEEKTGYSVTPKSAPAPATAITGMTDPAAGMPELPIANRSQAAGREARFEAAALEQITAAERAALQPLVDRVAELAGADDAAVAAGLAQLRADLPALERTLLVGRTPELERAFEEVIGTALVSGYAEAAQTRRPAARRGPGNAPKRPGGLSTPTKSTNGPRSRA